MNFSTEELEKRINLIKSIIENDTQKIIDEMNPNVPPQVISLWYKIHHYAVSKSELDYTLAESEFFNENEIVEAKQDYKNAEKALLDTLSPLMLGFRPEWLELNEKIFLPEGSHPDYYNLPGVFVFRQD
jgi:hypothetical protein